MNDDLRALLGEVAERARFFGTLTGIGLPPASLPPLAPVSASAADAIAAGAAIAATGPPAADGLTDLEGLRGHIGDCQRCKLAGTRKNIVFGQGDPRARLMFVGEAPGADEDEQGLAFVGRAGQLLTKIIEAIELRREDVYIVNILKCRPPDNRNPDPDEIMSCQPFLERQIDMIQPQVIVGLGKFAGQWLLKTAEPISRIRGRVGDYKGIRVIPTYHPAYLLRTPSAKKEVWEDMKLVRSLLQ